MLDVYYSRRNPAPRVCAVCGIPSDLCGAVMGVGSRPVMFVCFDCDDHRRDLANGIVAWVEADVPGSPAERGRYAYYVRVARRWLKRGLA